MLCLVFMGKPCTLMNRQEDIWPCVLCQIKNHTYGKYILIRPVFLILSIIIIYPNSYLNLGGCWQTIKTIHPFSITK